MAQHNLPATEAYHAASAPIELDHPRRDPRYQRAACHQRRRANALAHRAMSRPAKPSPTRLLLSALLLLAFWLRVATLDRLGLAYDEAATALMSRATPVEIVAFHWAAAFEHPPLWVLLMRVWSHLAGQSEFALRWLPALAGVLIIPLTWQLARRLWPSPAALPALSALLITLAPVMVYYSQEARMYTLTIALYLALTLLALRDQPPTWRDHLYFWLLSWAMLGLHYYTLVGLGLQAAVLALFSLAIPQRRPLVASLILRYTVAVLPLGLWFAFSPGFHATLHVVLEVADELPITWLAFLTDFAREIGFGAIRWQPPQSTLSYLLAPWAMLGLVALAFRRVPRPGNWLVITVVVIPLLSAALALRNLSPRYILWTIPFLYLLMAVAAHRLLRLGSLWARILGAVALSMILVVSLLGLQHYFGPYRKSDYRTMSRDLIARFDPVHDLLLLEAPRQHLLAKYYLPAQWPIHPMPTYPLPAYWPVTAPPLIPEDEDDRLLGWLTEYRAIWVSYSSETEVDRGEFLSKYLTAVAYLAECQRYLDVRICRYLTPHQPGLTPLREQPAAFADQLTLEAAAGRLHTEVNSAALLLFQLDWHAPIQPAADYKVSLRLIDTAGAILAQQDEYPIGPLLPPTTWPADARKPGYMALQLPPALPIGIYTVTASLYDPTTLAPLPWSPPVGAATDAPLTVAEVVVGDTIALYAPR